MVSIYFLNYNIVNQLYPNTKKKKKRERERERESLKFGKNITS